MNISTSELVKRSASQLLYNKIKKVEHKPTEKQVKGSLHSQEVCKKLEASSEKRGIKEINGCLFFFCIDLVKDNNFVEVKMVEDKYEDWYLHSAILQSTLYASLLSKVKTLDTPEFRKKEGYKQEILEVPNKFNFELWFGSQKYKIYQNDEILNHYINKASLIKSCLPTKDFDSCRLFDSEFKHREFEIFKPKYKLL